MTKETSAKNPRRNRTNPSREAAPVPKREKYCPAALHATASFSEEPGRSQIVWIVD